MTAKQDAAYRRVLDDLRSRILAGELGEGDRLPSVRKLVEQHGVPTGTVARAIAELRAQGYVVTRQGSGAYVRKFEAIRRSSPARLAREQWGAGRAIQDADTDKRPRSVDVVVGECAAPTWVASPLELEPAATVVFRSRRFVVEERSVQLATSYLPTDVARGTPIMHTDTGPGGIYARLAEAGLAPTRFTEYVRARMPAPDESTQLGIPEGTPVVEITRLAFAERDRCVEVSRMVLDGTAYLLDYSFNA